MHTLKYHAVNTAAVIFFSLVCAVTINSVVRFVLAPVQFVPTVSAPSGQDAAAKQPVDVNSIVDSGFFKLAVPEAPSGPAPSSEITDLVLMATMLGPDSVACAMIKKKSDSSPQIFMYKDRWKSDVFGYKLVSIQKTTVKLKSGDRIYVLDMYAKDTPPGAPRQMSADADQAGRIKKNLSRSDLQQKIRNNMDTMLKGLRAGPYMVNGKIDGYKLFIVNPDNYLYEIGARSGDVIKRINGHPIDSTEKLYKIWSGLPQESRVVLDLDRGGKTVTYDYTFTE